MSAESFLPLIWQAVLQPIDRTRVAYAAQSVPTEQNKTTVRANGRSEFCRHEYVSAQWLAQRFDAGDLVDRWSDDREVESVRGSDIAVKHFAQVQGQIDNSDLLTGGTARPIHAVDRCHRFNRRVERLAGRLSLPRIIDREDRQHAVAHELQDLGSPRA
jgi:hypothetical protein